MKIPTLLNDGPKSIKFLAEKTGLDDRKMRRVLRLLSANGIFRESRNDNKDKRQVEDLSKVYYENTPKSDILREEHPFGVYHMVQHQNEDTFTAFFEMDEVLKTPEGGIPPFVKVNKMNIFEYFAKNKESGENFNKAMSMGNQLTRGAIFDVYDFGQCKKLVDVGGGSGEFLRPLLDRFPNVTAVLFDLPEVVEHAKTFFGEKYNSRVQFVGGDFFKEVPAGADCYNVRYIFHDWNDEKATMIAKKVAEAMQKSGPGTKLTVVTNMLLDNEPFDIKYFIDLVMAITVDGKERTEAEFSTLLGKAGLKINKVYTTPSPTSLLEVVLK